ncbi:MAG TPA: glucose-6-phosphate dehydrogenase [Rhizomicrobium sp.]|nr:glucose-6-phosphate dehydrogenase [Rhizomicrobium sp.]
MVMTSSFVLFGATGDLSRRMLLPSLYYLDCDGLLPEKFAIVGAARSSLSHEDFIALARKALDERGEGIDAAAWERFSARLHYSPVDVGAASGFEALGALLEEINPGGGQLFYLSLSPNFYAPACAGLQAAGLATADSRIIIEKPIGRDLESCRAINAALLSAFTEDRIFRIDHYLGKETVQNLLALRFANILFEPLWNKAHVDHVEITVFETVGVEGRWAYYDEYGALRDMVQNHVLQLLCLVALEPPAKLDPDAVRDEKVKVLRSLKPIAGREVLSRTVRGQYADGSIDGVNVPGYAREAGGKPSDTESFVALCAEIENWRWAGVPFYLRTGKRMDRRLTEIVVQFRDVPHSVFGGDGRNDLIPNRLTITLQPEEQISLALMNKTPGLTEQGWRMNPLSLNLSLTDAFKTQRRRIAYEQLLLDALRGNQTLFVRGDETEAAWRWIDGIAAGWKETRMKPEPYWAGSDGPDRAASFWCRGTDA